MLCLSTYDSKLSLSQTQAKVKGGKKAESEEDSSEEESEEEEVKKIKKVNGASSSEEESEEEVGTIWNFSGLSLFLWQMEVVDNRKRKSAGGTDQPPDKKTKTDGEAGGEHSLQSVTSDPCDL